MGGGQAVSLHGGGVHPQQPRRLERVRRQHAGQSGLGSPAQGAGQRRVRRDRVERIRVQHQPGGVGQRLRQTRRHRVTTTAAADQGAGGQALRSQNVGLRARHQLGLNGVERQRMVVESGQKHPPGTRQQRCARRQQGRAAHPGRAAQNSHIAEAALVLGVQPRPQRGRAGQTGAGGGGVQGQVQGVEPDLAGKVAPLRREQARLERQQRQGVAGAHRHLTQRLAGVGGQA